MIDLTNINKIYVAFGYTDLRMGIDGYASLIELECRLPIDNNLAKRAMKNFVMGRKNFLFCFTEKRAKMSGITYSIVETATANNLNIFEYLMYLFDTLPMIDDDVDNLGKLLQYSADLPERVKVKK